MLNELRAAGIADITVIRARNGRSLRGVRHLLSELDSSTVVVTAVQPIGAVIALWLRGVPSVPVFHVFPTTRRSRIVAGLTAWCCPVLVGVSPAMQSLLADRFPQCEVIVIANPVAPPSFVRIDEARPMRVGVVSRLVERKGLELLDQILASLPTGVAALHVFGDGPLRPTLERLAARHEPYLVLHGFEPDLDRIYATIDRLLFLSEEETFGLPLAEAMAYAIPVVGYLEDPAPAWISRSMITFRAVERTAAFLSDALRVALETKVPLSERRRSHEAWAQSFTPATVTEEWRRLLARVGKAGE